MTFIRNLDPDETGQSDLRGGSSPWSSRNERRRWRSVVESLTCDAVVVGAGITGAFVAERLTRQGLDVVIVDRERPGRGSTAASTSMLLWEIDRSLVSLTEVYGFERAVRVYRASLEGVRGLTTLVRQLGLTADFREKNSLLLASGDTDAGLFEEHTLRCRAGLPGDFLSYQRLLETYGMARAAALISPGAADADPLQLADGLLRIVAARGARLFDAEAIAFDPTGRSVTVGLDNGREIQARSVVLSTGYVMPSIVHSAIQMVSSSWAIATVAQPQNLWKDGVLIWEDAEDYLYARTTVAGRIIIGGEDSKTIIEPSDRDWLIPTKAKVLVERLKTLWPAAITDVEHRWAGTFDTTRDGLPLIGRVPGQSGIYAAYGYGGNGITFSYLAAKLIGGLISGSNSLLFEDFALDRS